MENKDIEPTGGNSLTEGYYPGHTFENDSPWNRVKDNYTWEDIEKEPPLLTSLWEAVKNIFRREH